MTTSKETDREPADLVKRLREAPRPTWALLAEAAAQIERLERDARLVCAYEVLGCKVEMARQVSGPPLWAVRRLGECLNHSGGWEDEPLPSSRSVEFLARCRFQTARAAIDSAIAALATEQPAKE